MWHSIRRMFSLNDPGWGRNSGSGGGGGDGQRPRSGGDGPPDLDELWRDFNRRLNGMFGKRGGGGAPPSGEGSGGPGMRGAGMGVGVMALVAVLLWLGSGFYIVPEGNAAAILRFGEFKYLNDRAGFTWRIPYPVETAEIVNVQQLRQMEVGYRNNVKNKVLKESLMLTQDQSIVDMQFAVQYRVADPVAWLFNNNPGPSPEELVRQGRAEALMKGSLHTDELMAAVVSRDAGLRTARRISHCFVMDAPEYCETLIVTDAAINIAPTLEDKVDIVQNAIDLAHALHFPEVRVAILSAMETVNSKVPSTIEAAALCKMADRGQITGALVDGPLALDNAISPESVRIKHIQSPVAGRANVLVVPDLEAGNMLAKSLSFLARADAAGIVLGARVPIILTSRADSVSARLASCAIASLVAHARREAVAKAVA